MVPEVDPPVHYFVPSLICVRIAYPVLCRGDICDEDEKVNDMISERRRNTFSRPYSFFHLVLIEGDCWLSSGQLHVHSEILHHHTSRCLRRRKEDEIEHQLHIEWSVMQIITWRCVSLIRVCWLLIVVRWTRGSLAPTTISIHLLDVVIEHGCQWTYGSMT